MRLNAFSKFLVLLAGLLAGWLVLRPLIAPGLEELWRGLRHFTPLELLVLVVIAALLARAASRTR